MYPIASYTTNKFLWDWHGFDMNIPILDGGGGERETMGNLHLQDRTQDELAEPPDAWRQKMRMRRFSQKMIRSSESSYYGNMREREVAIYIYNIYIYIHIKTFKQRERHWKHVGFLLSYLFQGILKKVLLAFVGCWLCWLENWSDMPTWKHSVYAVRFIWDHHDLSSIPSEWFIKQGWQMQICQMMIYYVHVLLCKL